jgi:hypothetical protein
MWFIRPNRGLCGYPGALQVDLIAGRMSIRRREEQAHQGKNARFHGFSSLF